MKAWTRRWGGAAACAAATLLVLAGLHLLTAKYLHSRGCFNSDDLTMLEFCDDLLAGKSLAGWHLPGAPYLVPDVLLLLPCRLVFRDLAWLLLAYSVLYYALIVAALYWLQRLAGSSPLWAYLSACLGVLFLVALNLSPECFWRSDHLARPGSHVGAILPGLLALGCLLQLARDGWRTYAALLFVAGAGLSAFSDRLLLLQWFAPAGLCLGILWCLRRLSWRRLLTASGLLAASALVAEGCKALLAAGGILFLDVRDFVGLTTWEQLGDKVRAVLADLEHQPGVREVIVLFVVVAALAVVLNGWRCLRDRTGAFTLPLAVSLAGLLVVVAGIGPFVVGGKLAPISCERYCFPLTVVPPLLLPLAVRLLWHPETPRLRVGAQAVTSLAVVLFFGWEARQAAGRYAEKPLAQPYPELAQLIDRAVREHGCTHGYAGYWEARRLRYLARERTVILPVTDPVSPFLHGSNPYDHVQAPGGPEGADAPVFIVPTQIPWPNPGTLQSLFSAPKERLSCAEGEVWVYDRLENDKLEVFFNSFRARALRRGGVSAPACPGSLARIRDNYTSEQKRGLVRLRPGTSCDVWFLEPQHGPVLDISASVEGSLEVTLYHGAEEVGQVSVPPLHWTGHIREYGPPGLHARLLPLPASAQERGWDRAVVRSLVSDKAVSVGHLVVHQHDVPFRAPTQAVSR